MAWSAKMSQALLEEWLDRSPLTALARKTPLEPQYAERLYIIGMELYGRGDSERARWTFRLYHSACGGTNVHPG